jgi:glycosyltransferase involved in cell wall biosynthesis
MSSHKVHISVIIPTYNSENYLAQTLATVAKQDYQPYEVIVVDGGSTDGTQQIVESFRPLITTFISEPDKGQLDAVQKGIRLATGDVLYWLNADDAVMPKAFECAINAFASDPSIDIVFGDNYWFDEEMQRIGVAHSVKYLSFWDQFLFYGQLQVEAFFCRREVAYKALPFDTSLRVYTDYSFFLPVRYGAKCKWVPLRLGAFRVHSEQMHRLNIDMGKVERGLIKQRMRERLGLSEEQFNSLRRKRFLGFFIRHKLLTKLTSGLRYTGRKLSGDYMRNKLSYFFFDEWLKLPNNVKLNEIV